MRHGKKVNHLGRTASHRKAMLANMATSLILHKRIKTTVAKAKALKKYVEPLITRAKAENNTTIERSTHNRRVVFSYLRNKEGVKELFSTVAEKVGDRPGGYTRIIKLGQRYGDAAEMCLIELVDFNETLLQESSAKKKRTRRKSKKTTEAAAEVETKETKEEAAGNNEASSEEE
ncbi:50S ribosomal protein L17 [Thermonema rossianum]|uniref:50S ribosomal protein L17 n=1 Tax=Thermonema rossianum TaxID=55505 RepID=UPI000570654C|nr:50S ribosomal protein L17 [Thermonema rossianum]